jgi:Chalcone isomerase-like
MAGSEWKRRSSRRRLWRAAALALLLVCAPPAVSGTPTIDGVTFPSALTVDGRILHLNGVGLRTLTLFRIHAYVAALYLEHPGHDSGAIEASTEIKTLFLKFLQAASQERVQGMLRRDEAKYCAAAVCPASDAQDIERLVALFPAVKRGDYATYVFSPRGVRVLMNNVPLVTFGNPDFARRLLDAFIGPHATVQSLRNALLGHS